MVAYAGRSRPQLGDDTPGAHRRWATKLAYERGGVAQAASALISLAETPRNVATLELLHSKYPSGEQAANFGGARHFGGDPAHQHLSTRTYEVALRHEQARD